MELANGAFAGSSGKVYLAQEFVNSNSVDTVAVVFLEELGHYLDSQLNPVDSAGDEGAIFANLVQGNSLDQATLAALKAEDDSATVTLDGEVVEIEQMLVPGDLDDVEDFLDDQDGKDNFLYENVATIDGEFRARFKNIILPPANTPYIAIPGDPAGGDDSVTPLGTVINPLPSTVKGLAVHTSDNPSTAGINDPWTPGNEFNDNEAEQFLNLLGNATDTTIQNLRHLFAEDTYNGTAINVGILRHVGIGSVKVTLDWTGSAANDLDLYLDPITTGQPNVFPTFIGTETTVTNDNIEQIFSNALPAGDYHIYVDSAVATPFTQDFSIFVTTQINLGQGHGWGDVHLVTFDGKAYDFQAVGEFILVESLIDDFEVQTRQEPWGTSNRVSVNTAFATTIDGLSVVYDLNLPAGQRLSIGGTSFDLLSGQTLNLGNNQIQRQGNQYTFTYAGPDRILATADDDRVTAYIGGSYINVYVDPADYRSNLLQGLLGNGDGIRTNDFALRDGTDLGPNPSVQTIHTTYAESWRITQAESLFGTPTFADPNFPSQYTSLADLAREDPEAVAAAFEAARAAGIPEGPFLEAAVLDFVVTEDESFIEGTKEFADFVIENEGEDTDGDGVIELGQIHGYKWNDLDGDGVWDQGEEGLSGWTIYLDSIQNGQLDEGELSTTTDENGAYGFTDLGPGTYTIGEVMQDGWQQTSPLQNLVIYNAVELEAGEIVEDVNFGNQQKPGQIHGYKWNDLDGDGVWDEDEQGLADWTIYIDANGNGQLDEGELSTTTDENGAYGFTDLGPGTYTIGEVMQDGWQQTYPLQNLAIYNAVELEAGEIVEDVNFGNHLECAPPELTNPIRGQSLTVQPSATAGVSEFTFAADTFVDPDPGDVITYTAEKLIGVTGWTQRFVGGVWDPVATGWSSADIIDNDLASGPVIGLSFDPATRTFQTYTNDNQFHWVRVIATDNGGKQDVTYFDFSNRNGTVIDNYIVNANVFLDLNGNGQHDADEPFGISDENGNFNFGGFSILDYDLNQNGNLDPNEASIVAIGGVDIGTGLPLETPLRATPDATTVSLLTSLVADLVDRGLTVEEANTSVTNALSIPSDIGINSFDPIEATNNNELGGVETFAAMVQVQNVITQVAGLIDGASSASNGEIVDNVVSAITSEIQLGTPLDLTHTAQLQTIIDNTATSTGVNLDHLSAQAAEVIAAANEKIEEAVANSPTEDLEEAFAKVQKVALGDSTEDLEQAGAGTKSIDEVVAENTGSGLEEQIDKAQVLSEAPTDIDLSNNSVAENLPIGTEVGTFSTVDPDTGETHTYSLVSGLGDTDNDLFEIAGDRLLTKASFDQDTQDSYSIRVLTSDGNGGVYSEEFTINVNEEITREIVEPTIIGEVGSVSNFNHQSKTINFNQTYDNPVVIAGPLSYNGRQTATVRIEEVTENGFTAFIQEPSNHDGWHIRESFSYLVLEAGTWQIEDGALVEVGAIDTNATVKYGWETIDLDANFQETPAIFSEVQSYNGGDFVRTRHRSDSAESFQFSMEEEEQKLWGGHVTETVGYVALSPGSGTINELDYTAGSTPDSVTHNWYNLDFQPNFANSPNFIAQLATYDGTDSAGLRYQNLTGDNVQVKVEEDTSKDWEKWHTTEKVNFLAIEDGALSAYDHDPITGMAIINGSDSDEILVGTKGDDQINGGLGRDVFVFGEGEDVVSDFTDGIDLIGLTGDLEFSSLAVTQVSGDSVVSFGVESLTLIGVDSNLLTESDFVSIAI